MDAQAILTTGAAIVSIVGTYHIFKKANLEGWKAIIPFYSDYTEYKLVWDTKMFWAYLACFLTTIICGGVATALKAVPVAALILSLVALVPAIMALILSVKESYRLSTRFGHGKGYTAGLVLLAPIFRCILGFDQSQYQEA